MIRVLLAEPLAMMRGGLVALLADETDIRVVADLQDGCDLLPVARRVRPEVAVIDTGLLGADGVETLRQFHAMADGCQVLLLTAMRSRRELRLVLDGNVRGLLVKDAPPSRLAECIRCLGRGEYAIDSDLVMSAVTGDAGPLNHREVDILTLAAQGCSPAEIADKLHLATGTVRNYIAGVLRKLGARNRLDAVRIARERHLI